LDPHHKNISCIGGKNKIIIFKYPSMEIIKILEGHTDYIYKIIHLHDYNINYIASASQDNSIRIWNISEMNCEKILNGHTGWIVNLCTLKRDPNLLISKSYDTTIKFWNIPRGELVKTITAAYGNILGNPFHINESYLIYSCCFFNVNIYDYESDSIVYKMKGHLSLVNCYADLQNFNKYFIATYSSDKSIKVWNLQNKSLMNSMNCNFGIINSLILLNNVCESNSLMASSSDDNLIRIWSLINYECVSTIKIHDSWCKSIIQLNGEYSKFILSHGDLGIVKLSEFQIIS
jgi:WD40 repeat protein